jgi:hypothetical protein
MTRRSGGGSAGYGGRRAGAGRPPLPPHEKLAVAVTVWATEEEAAQWRTAAEDQDVALSEYLREAINAHCERRGRR